MELEKPAKRLKTGSTPPQLPQQLAKKPVKLKSPTPLRKKLLPEREQLFQEEVAEQQTSREVGYDDVYTVAEAEEEKRRNVQKIRQLQQNELQCMLDQVTIFSIYLSIYSSLYFSTCLSTFVYLC